jgi:hypothetical protein
MATGEWEMNTLTRNLFETPDGFSGIGNPVASDPSTDWGFSDPFGGAGPVSGTTVAVGDLGTMASLASGGQTGSTGTTASASSPAPTVVTTPGSGLVIDLHWDSSVTSAPAGFQTDVIAAAQFIESQISNGATINLDVGYNEIDGSALGSGALGESESSLVSVSYSQLVAALKATASTDATDTSLLASLPATAPVSGTWWVTTAQAKALGLAAANGTGLDGAIGFGPSSEFTYGDTNSSGTVATNTYDFFATATHEITETMGRMLLVGSRIDRSTAFTLMDLTHYSAAGVRDFTQSTPGYFSVNGGATALGAYNTIAGGDAGDWASSVGDNSFDAYATPGVLEPVTTNDITEMDAIGWNLNGASTTPGSPTVTPTAPVLSDQTGTQSWTEGQAVTLTLPADTFTDPQGEALTYTATQSNGQALPSWLTFTPSTRTFSGTAPSTATSLSLRVTATDTGGLATSETFAANVAPASPAPGITVSNPTANQTWTGGENVILALPANTFTDALGLKMTFAAYEVSGTNVTSWLHFNSTTETFFGTVPANQSGSAILEVIAQDGARFTAADLFAVRFAAAGSAHPMVTTSLGAASQAAPYDLAALMGLHTTS